MEKQLTRFVLKPSCLNGTTTTAISSPITSQPTHRARQTLRMLLCLLLGAATGLAVPLPSHLALSVRPIASH